MLGHLCESQVLFQLFPFQCFVFLRVPRIVTRILTQLIRVENNAEMNRAMLRVVSCANAVSRGHINDKELAGALEQ